MTSLKEYLNEAKETYTINGIKVKEGEPIWIDKDGESILVTLDAIYGSKLIYKVEDDYGKEKLFNVPVSSFIETDKMAVKRQKEELKKGKSSGKDAKIKKQILELEKELEELNNEMENDPDIISELEAGGGKTTDEYGRRQNKLYDKIEKLRSQLSESLDEAGPGAPPAAPAPGGPGMPPPAPQGKPMMPPPPGRPGHMFGGPNHRPVGLVSYIKNNRTQGMSYDELVDWCERNGACKKNPEEQLTKEKAKDMAKDVYEHIQKSSKKEDPKVTVSNVKAAVDALDKWVRRE